MKVGTVPLSKNSPSAYRRGVFFCSLLLGAGIILQAPAQTPDINEPQVRFMTYNLKNYLPMNRRVDGVAVQDAPKPTDEIEAVVNMIAAGKPDILGVCEIGLEDEIKDLQTRLKNAGLVLPEFEWVRAASDQPRNLALLSRFPIVARHSKSDLSYRIGDRILPFQRGILDVTVAPAPEYRLRLVGLHLKSKREVPEADQALMRRNEADLARSHIDTIFQEEPGVNLLVYGDFNDTRNEMPVRILRGRYGADNYLDDIDAEDRNGHRWTHYWEFADEYARLDFILISKGAKKEFGPENGRIIDLPKWQTASDHRPVTMSLRASDGR